MDESALRLRIGQHRLLRRLEALDTRIEQGDESAWEPYLKALEALAQVVPATAPGAQGQAITTQELATRFGISTKTARRRGLAGQLPGVEAIRLARRGPAALRWRKS